MSKYQIWNGTDTVYTYGPPYKFTPEEWIAKYPWAEVSPCVISGEGAINGSFCMPLADMVAQAANRGCDFSACTTDAEKLATLEAFEQEEAAKEAEAAAESKATSAMNGELTAMSLASIAASMEYQNMMTLPDEEV